LSKKKLLKKKKGKKNKRKWKGKGKRRRRKIIRTRWRSGRKAEPLVKKN